MEKFNDIHRDRRKHGSGDAKEEEGMTDSVLAAYCTTFLQIQAEAVSVICRSPATFRVSGPANGPRAVSGRTGLHTDMILFRDAVGCPLGFR